MDFKSLLSAEARAELEVERKFIMECWEATDVELGRIVLKLATDIRTRYPKQFEWTARGDGYSGSLVWEVIPEIARRLGVQDFARGKRPYLLQEENEGDLGLRAWTGSAIFGTHRAIHLDDGTSVTPMEWRLIQHEPVNGNPVVIALDRVAAPTHDRSDELARRIAEISRVRGFPEQRAWSPAMMGRPPEAEDSILPFPTLSM